MRWTVRLFPFICRSAVIAGLFAAPVCSVQFTLGQDTLMARQLLDTLCSPAFAGRGYHFEGQQRAGMYLMEQMRAWGLQSVASPPCTVRVARYDTVQLKVGRRWLRPGIDYTLPAGSGVGSGLLTGLPRFSKDSGYYREKNKYLYYYNTNINKSLSESSPHLAAYSNSRSMPSPGTPRVEVEWRKGPFIGSLTDSIGCTTRLRIDPGVLPKRPGRLRWHVGGELSESRQHNIQGLITGTRYPDSILLVCAHYDHLGMLGRDCLYPGANDNASGTALLMDLARHYAQPRNRPAYSLMFVAFAAEEAGLIGSRHYTAQPPIPLAQHILVINLDLMGGGSNGLMVVNGQEEAGVTDLIRRCNAGGGYFSRIDVRANAPNSDHYPFTQRGIPAVFLYTQGDVTAYHHPADRAEDLAWRHYTHAFRLLRDVVDRRMTEYSAVVTHPNKQP